MPEPILCPECGHDIDDHRALYMCNGCGDEIFTKVENELCYLYPSDIAHIYTDERLKSVLGDRKGHHE